MITTLVSFILLAVCAQANTLQWVGGGRNGGYLAVSHHGIRDNARNGDTVWM